MLEIATHAARADSGVDTAVITAILGPLLILLAALINFRSRQRERQDWERLRQRNLELEQSLARTRRKRGVASETRTTGSCLGTLFKGVFTMVGLIVVVLAALSWLGLV